MVRLNTIWVSIAQGLFSLSRTFPFKLKPMWGSFYFFQGVRVKNMKKSWLMSLGFVLSCCFLSGNVFSAEKLPQSVLSQLTALDLKPSQMAVSVRALDGGALALDWQSAKHVSPASTEKIMTTLVALELLGPHYQWYTDFGYEGVIEDGVLKGTLHIRGGGDPQYTIEDLWKDVGYLRARGIVRIEGDIVIDRTLFSVTPKEGDFDHQASRPYNKEADAALLNYQSVSLKLEPDPEAGFALVTATPALVGLSYPQTVKLTRHKSCYQWRQKLEADVSDPLTPVFEGGFPKGCESKTFSYLVPEANQYWQAAIAPIFAQHQIVWTGAVRDGLYTDQVQPLLRSYSDDLASIVRLTNKFSNNVFARHLFLTAGLESAARTLPATYELARETVSDWMTQTVGVQNNDFFIDNGSGLSRKSFVTARAMTQVIAHGWQSPRMPDWIASFPISGMDGTMMKRPVATGSAYLKTGLISGVKSVAGIIQAQSGHRYAVFAVVQGAKATYSDEPIDHLIDWVYREG